MPLAYLTRIAQTPAPTFHEEERAQLLAHLWRDLGHAPERDAVGNVLLRLGPRQGKALLLAAHLDTVFGPETDVTVREEGGRLVGPGVGDNSSSLAVLTAFLRDLDPAQLRRPLWIAANVGEEGLGDLRGAKALLSEHAPELSAFVAVDGYLGVAVTKAVGVRRYRVMFSGQGGHSWGDQAPSALHALGLAITALYSLPLPSSPRTTLNVGVASGGNSVNSIASSAELLLDLRSLDAQLLDDLDSKARHALQGAARQVGVQLRLDQVGDRPGGNLRSDNLLRLARLASQPAGLELKTAASSTDANAAAPHGVPSLALGVYRGGNAHREDEWVQPGSLATGLGVLQRFVRAYQHD
ncbi:acetylornithine deacetylase [Deinococcus irradiatisoli]|uniref:Acetylornithine deacetylase n=1 Tax=Deinococcus irradiatisoli TaxID=2202254 RepID=A0A2Z3JSX8_9DEIO|nr:M20/M25/M40 family metallo-hydrolase [Deinococcus irradiatisoli]AWN24338.1 acetylornithine deacetylase [Deinococcus irradiatisoli]